MFNHPDEADIPTILIAHDDYRVVNVIKKVVEPIKCKIETVFEGNEAYKIIKDKKPAIAIIDVALTGLFGFELCEKVKNDPQLKDVKVILVASIYDRTRYKRRPQNLYGADDYIEKHHIPDELLNKVLSLLPDTKKLPLEKDLKTQKEIEDSSLLKDNRDLLLEKTKNILKERDEIRQHEQASLDAIPETTSKAKKLARLIISDIALYNQEILDTLTKDNFKEILKLDFEDAVKYLSHRIPEIKNDSEKFIEEAFIEVLNKRKDLK
jgi:DNA-binding response OmpR family regulator